MPRNHAVFDAYPLIPWIAVMAAGYVLGAIDAWPAPRRRAFLVRAGVAMIVGFVALLHVVALVISAIQFSSIGNPLESPSSAQFPATFPPGWGLSLPWTYVTWLAVVIAVYPACRWFAGLKQRRRDWWLGYL